MEGVNLVLGRIKENAVSYFCLFLLAVMFVYIASFSTSPLYPFYCQGDSAQFQTIGKAWLCGKIPYRDMFDHKGPVIFLVDMLGFSLNGKSSGITVIQIICMFVTLVYLYKISQLVCKNKIYGIMACILSVLVLTSVYGDGNFTEEYCLPFISISTYYQYCYFIKSSNDSVEHDPVRDAVYGFSFGVCLLSRVTNAITVCAGILVISFILLYKRKYMNFIENAVGFIIGLLIIIVPFSIYFAQYGVFSEFIYATIQYNIEYKSRMSSWLFNAGIGEWMRFGVWYFTSYIIFIVTVFAFLRKKYAFAVYCSICGILECYLYLSGALYYQYAIITLPQFVLLLNEIVLINNKKIWRRIKIICMAAVVSFCFVCTCKFAFKCVNMYDKYKVYNQAGYEQLLEIIPQNERVSFVAYGDNRMKGLYLLNDLMPCYKYFILQEWHAGFSDFVKDDIHRTYEEGNAAWILTCGATDNIQDVLDSRYQLTGEAGDYRLFRLKHFIK